ncbi:MAG: hypothetical protein H6698_02240 [Myxococcales bacterium]|nr:hypothetical protein [Myxococcales bacterium]MCB9532505.1 hypothetical protein [Myxococcales bacterium]MCB9533131.1 hypothetical protein [Myxococcales bacterium]
MATPFDSRPPAELFDGIRDPLRWSRFARPRLMVAGTLLWVLVSLGSARDPAARAGGKGAAAGAHVVTEAIELCGSAPDALPTSRADTLGAASATSSPSPP